MSDSKIYIKTFEGIERSIDWTELNQLKKDILWIYAENTNQLNSSFVPVNSFPSKYWEFLSLDGDKWFYAEDRNFYTQGMLIIILCMTIEYIDTTGGDQSVFGQTEINTIIQYVHNFQPANSDQEILKQVVELGLNIANSMTDNDLINTNAYQHNDLDKFYNKIDWVDTTFIKSYFQNLSK